jgi:integrase/recombinase XerD
MGMKNENLNFNLLLIKKPRGEEFEETDEMRYWLEKFKEEREFDGIKKETIKGDLARLSVFLGFCYHRLKKSPDKLKTHDFVKFFNYLERERGVSKNTQRKYYLLLKVFYKVMRMQHVIKEFVEESRERKRFAKIEIKKRDPADAEIINMVLQKIMASRSRTKIRDALIIRFKWDTGCRISEILNLKLKDCDLEKGIFRITDTKSHEERIVACREDTLEFLRQYVQFNIRKDPNAYLFQNHNGDKVDRNWISYVFRKAIRELQEEGRIPKNKRIVLHSVRSGRIMDLLEKLPIDVVSEIVGHHSIEVTMRYVDEKKRLKDYIKILKKI